MEPAACPTAAELPEPGRIYQHYKGDFYRVVTLGRLSEERETWMVAYFSLARKCVWMRPLTMFQEIVRWPDGHMRPRFTPTSLLPRPAVITDDIE